MDIAIGFELEQRRDALLVELAAVKAERNALKIRRDALQADLAEARAEIARLHVALDASQANDHRYWNVPDE